MTADRIGERLRRYRRAANKTLNQVAGESGLTASFLSQAERNLTGVSISSLANIAKSLGIPLNALFDQPLQPQPDSHQGERVRYTIEGQPLAYERLSSSFPGNLLNAVKMSMPVGYQSELIAHEGAEFAYVLSGRIVYTIEGRQYPLGPGDSVHFDAGKTHRLANVGSEVAEVLTVTTMGLFDDHNAL
ncbi:MAG: cupin domain-containing protein [Pseudomonadota bacterium]